jgi:hypothetical protein
MKRSPQQAMALVITLIMLSMITIVAVAFLAIARRDRASVTQAGNITDSQLMADAAVERAVADLASRVRRFEDGTNGWLRRNFCALLVSTNQDVGLNAWIDPRAPVKAQGKTNRWYIDLNRDWNANLPGPSVPSDTNSPFLPGDPQWIGVLEKPWTGHAKDNRYIGRFVFIALPVGKALDANYIFNNIKQNTDSRTSGYLRGPGFGSWDINLAALFADINTNIFGYQYNTDSTPSRYGAFTYAQEMLNFRYDNNFANIASADAYFKTSAFDMAELSAFVGQPWPGSDYPSRFYSLHDVFHTRSTYYGQLGKFLANLPDNGYTTPYDLSTYYRLVEQLGTDSLPEPPGKINLNFINTTNIPTSAFIPWTSHAGVITNGPELFFHEVAGKLLKEEYPFMSAGIWKSGVWSTNDHDGSNGVPYNLPGIPILIRGSTYTTNYNIGPVPVVQPLYSSRVHQLLQISANIYDANHAANKGEGFPYLPTVFRPQFAADPVNGHVSITNYVEETSTNFIHLPWVNLESADAISQIQANNGNVNIYGIPFIIGARKGLPNFNELVLQNVVQIVRKLEIVKKDGPWSTNNYTTNQMYVIGISNVIGVEAWNSYNAAYPRNLAIAWKNNSVSSLGVGPTTVQMSAFTPPWFTNSLDPWSFRVPANSWIGGDKRGVQAFMPKKAAGTITTTLLPNSVLDPTSPTGIRPVTDTNAFFSSVIPAQLGLTITNLFAFFIIDTDQQRVIDAVSLYATNYFDISRELNSPLARTNSANTAVQYLWRTNIVDSQPMGVSEGITNQIFISLNGKASDQNDWNNFSFPSGLAQSKDNGITNFFNFLFTPNTGKLSCQTPFNPVRKMWQTISWQANDPLVHYRIDDLWDDPYDTNHSSVVSLPYTAVQDPWGIPGGLGDVNLRYKPWAYEAYNDAPDPNDVNLAVKDPGMYSSDYWDFPTNKFPNIGSLGRVHRGTPWQTIYLKSEPAWMPSWSRFTGGAFSPETHPTNDWRLVDLFTVAVNSNATRGTLSINQTNVAAWSAVLSGITASTLTPEGDRTIPVIVQPASKEAAVAQIVAGINAQREFQVGGRKNIQFNRLGDILATPELTVRSPFLNSAPYITETNALERTRVLRDRDYEAIPEQILSLLKQGDDRFVIYAWGQSLKPASVDTVTSIPNNYQITGEMATRTVVHFTTNNQAVVEHYNLMPPE